MSKKKEELVQDKIDAVNVELNIKRIEREKYRKIFELEDDDNWVSFLKLYTEEEPKRLSSALVSVQPLSNDTIALLQEKQQSIRHFKLFIARISNLAFDLDNEIRETEDYCTRLISGEIELQEGE